MDAVRKINNYYTYEDYNKWDDSNRWELIDGEAYAMAPAPSVGHQSVSLQLSRQIGNYLESKSCKVLTAPIDVRINADSLDDTVVQPDILIICDDSKIEKNGRSIIGAPDFIIEILSPSTAKFDWVVKKKLYQEYGVREYWIVDPDIKAVLTHVLFDGIGYVSRSYGEQDTTVPIEILEGCTIDLTKVFNDSDLKF